MKHPRTHKKNSSTADQEEIQHFSKDSLHWWDENGPFAPLHKLNPLRMTYIKSQICQHFSLDNNHLKALNNLKILDIGCGGGLVCEPLARLGAVVTGIDADTNAIEVARNHAQSSGLAIAYHNIDLQEIRDKFDVILALEVVEHVSDLKAFIQESAQHLNPNGLVIFSTLNRTAKSYALGIIMAEYVLGWVPKGTHHWNKFVKPSELGREARYNSLKLKDIKGMVFDPVKRQFCLSEQDVSVNYFMCFCINNSDSKI